jgi:L,D-peptidoglycan transpeptidase YkuD (ErfK/YbiS/YcfS/YnhG family)
MGWCDDPFSEDYNREITINKNFLFSFERLFRKDNIYDLIAVLNYNSNPIIKNKGSAIFIHIARKNYTPTKGCLALKKKDLINILSNIRKNTLIKITNN